MNEGSYEYSGAIQNMSSQQLASTSSFGMSGANAHMVMASVGAPSTPKDVDVSSPWMWQHIQLQPFTLPLHLAAQFHYLQRGKVKVTSDPFSPATWPLSQTSMFGRNLIHPSVLIEAALAASHKLHDLQPHVALSKVLLDCSISNNNTILMRAFLAQSLR